MEKIEDAADEGLYFCYSTIRRENGEKIQGQGIIVRGTPLSIRCLKLKFKEPVRVEPGETITITHHFIKTESRG